MEKAACVRKEAVATRTLTAPPTLMALEKELETREKCYNKTVGEEATLLESAKDYFSSSRRCPRRSTESASTLKNYFSQKCSSVFGKQKVEPVVKDETPEVANPGAVS